MGAVTICPGEASRESVPLVKRTAPVRTKKVSSCSRWTCWGGPVQPGTSWHSMTPMRPEVELPSSSTRKVAPPASKVSGCSALMLIVMVGSAEAAGDVVLGGLLVRVAEDLLGGVELDQPAGLAGPGDV